MPDRGAVGTPSNVEEERCPWSLASTVMCLPKGWLGVCHPPLAFWKAGGQGVTSLEIVEAWLMQGPGAAGIDSSPGPFQLSASDWQRHLDAKNTLVDKYSLFQLKLNTTAIRTELPLAKELFKFSDPIPEPQEPMVIFCSVSFAGWWVRPFPHHCPLVLPLPASRKRGRGGGEGPVASGVGKGRWPAHL